MKGYLRRKVTYNIGRKDSSKTKEKDMSEGGGNSILLRPPTIVPKHIILDAGMRFPAEKVFVKKGIDEGWLKRTGYYSLNHEVYFTYTYSGGGE